MKKVQKGFTLVELIVVITILAILATIAFISLQGYSQDARDSKAQSDVRSIASVIETKLTGGTSVHTFMGSADSNNEVANVADGSGTFGSGVTMTGSTYNVGLINYIALAQSSEDFGASTYRIGTFTTTTGGQSYIMYQVAGIKGSSDAPAGVVKGNYIYNATASDELGLVSLSGATTGLQDGDALAANSTF